MDTQQACLEERAAQSLLARRTAGRATPGSTPTAPDHPSAVHPAHPASRRHSCPGLPAPGVALHRRPLPTRGCRGARLPPCAAALHPCRRAHRCGLSRLPAADLLPLGRPIAHCCHSPLPLRCAGTCLKSLSRPRTEPARSDGAVVAAAAAAGGGSHGPPREKLGALCMHSYSHHNVAQAVLALLEATATASWPCCRRWRQALLENCSKFTALVRCVDLHIETSGVKSHAVCCVLRAVHPLALHPSNRHLHFLDHRSFDLTLCTDHSKHRPPFAAACFCPFALVSPPAVALWRHGFYSSCRISCTLHSPFLAPNMPPPLCQHSTSTAAAPACARPGRVPELVPGQFSFPGRLAAAFARAAAGGGR